MSAENKEVEEPQLPQKETLLDFVWNKKKKAFLGRTCLSWLKIGIFYIVFYSCLAGWFAGLLHAFYSTLDETAPTWHGDATLLQGNPGMGFRPLPRIDSTLIRFHQDSPGSYRPYIDHLEAFFKTYENVADTANCTVERSEEEQKLKPCGFDLQAALDGAECRKSDDYGYEVGNPCVALKLNKQYGWKPDVYFDVDDLKKANELAEVPRDLSFENGTIGINCDGQNAVDRQNIVSIKITPGGISKNFYPYYNQKGFRSPIVFVKLEVVKHVTVQVACKVWVRNADNSDTKESRGTAHFELLID